MIITLTCILVGTKSFGVGGPKLEGRKIIILPFLRASLMKCKPNLTSLRRSQGDSWRCNTPSPG